MGMDNHLLRDMFMKYDKIVAFLKDESESQEAFEKNIYHLHILLSLVPKSYFHKLQEFEHKYAHKPQKYLSWFLFWQGIQVACLCYNGYHIFKHLYL